LIQSRKPAAATSTRGQALVEFSLVLPILLILLLTVGDFGRLFASTITVESSAGAASETAATEYLREIVAVAPAPLAVDAYIRVHKAAWQSVCDEGSGLPNSSPGSLGGQCDGLPTVVCVHDGADPDCGNVYNAASGIPADCPSLQAGARPTNAQAGGTETSKYVEVRVCYRFSTFFQISIPSVGGTLATLGGDFHVERSRVFTVADY
jgi:hypothetical protein